MTASARLCAALTLSQLHTHDPGAQSTLPGFGVSVLDSDLTDWIEAKAPHISPQRRPAYIREYDVAGKVARAKLDGHWPP